MSSKTIIPCLLGVFTFHFAQAQTTLNPDISIVGDIRAFSHDDGTRQAEREELNLQSPEMELMAAGYLNPYARADAVVAWHGQHNAEIEEAYATILRGLPFRMNVRAGKYLLEFGRLNPVHEHAWSFVRRPLPHERFFGDHGLAAAAVRTSFLPPTGDAYTELMGAVLKGDALTTAHHHDTAGNEATSENGNEAKRVDLGFFGRLTTSLAVSDYAELALGASVLNAVYHVHVDTVNGTQQQLRTWVAGVDAKYKYKPSRYTMLQMEAEGLLRSDEGVHADKLTSHGGYGYIDYRFRQKYNVGGIFEWVRLKELHEHEGENHHAIERDIWRAGLFLGFAPIEQTSLLRLSGHWTEPDEADGFWEITVQFVFSLGPHQPHNF